MIARPVASPTCRMRRFECAPSSPKDSRPSIVAIELDPDRIAREDRRRRLRPFAGQHRGGFRAGQSGAGLEDVGRQFSGRVSVAARDDAALRVAGVRFAGPVGPREHRDLPLVVGGELEGGRGPGDPGADDQDVGLHQDTASMRSIDRLAGA